MLSSCTMASSANAAICLSVCPGGEDNALDALVEGISEADKVC